MIKLSKKTFENLRTTQRLLERKMLGVILRDMPKNTTIRKRKQSNRCNKTQSKIEMKLNETSKQEKPQKVCWTLNLLPIYNNQKKYYHISKTIDQ